MNGTVTPAEAPGFTALRAQLAGASPFPSGPRVTDEASYRTWLGSLDTDALLAEIERGTAEVEQATGKSIRRAA